MDNSSGNSSLSTGVAVSDVVYIQMHFSKEKWGQWAIIVSYNQIIVLYPAIDDYWWQKLPEGTHTQKGSVCAQELPQQSRDLTPEQGRSTARVRRSCASSPAVTPSCLSDAAFFTWFLRYFSWSDDLKLGSASPRKTCGNDRVQSGFRLWTW